jgi:hypothetical protein
MPGPALLLMFAILAAEPPAPLDFELLPPPPDAPADARVEELERQAGRRRTMLTVHQAMGIATWVGLGTTVTIGQLNFNDRYRGGGATDRWRSLHKGLAYGTSASFLSVGLLGLLAPEPYEKQALRWDTATVHKISMVVATAGMLGQVALGYSTRTREGDLGQRRLANAHLACGYATYAAMTVGAAALIF